ncbi:MAG: M67 family metallopeptidase [Methylomonas sp.]|nr:M67 family metallopeptidase [Methylomonas sp.]PPD19722.1 MAG: hypothetical protein CTY23_11035 [Methylomonas sp.]PPD25031.1 MAG: hypothetical protein CTY22_09890 [Methylomonas sp.]PPD39809.1 MAG: hypothetical protein CTY17_07515 [Methylomonas sp.]PPD51371.1 MAG: hypothetical protein CTY11_12265 [Methylomonas sp.]
MTSHEICLPRKLINQLLHLAQQSPDHEICGLISANSTGKPTTCYPISNSASTPKNRYVMNPSEQIAAMRTLRERGEQLFAIYHSHPHSPAEPSTTDIDQASYPDALYLIISLNTQGVLEMRGFKPDGDRFIEQNLCLVENT